MTRGTTPTLKLTISSFTDMSDMSVYVSLKQNKVLQTYSNESEEVYIDGNTIELTLTQTETLAFEAGACKLQVRGLVKDTGVAWSTNVVNVAINPVLFTGVIE